MNKFIVQVRQPGDWWKNATEMSPYSDALRKYNEAKDAGLTVRIVLVTLTPVLGEGAE